jgi:hypothetical protein
LTDRNAPRDVREKVMASVCARFTTVLGPGSDGYHENHIHLDLAERRNGYRICHWIIHDGTTEIATPMPSPRPDGAPPRELASRDDAQPAPNDDPKQIENVKVQPAPPPSALSLSPVPLARQPADVARPIAVKPEAAKSDVSESEAGKSDSGKPAAARPALKSSRDAKRAARESVRQPMQIAPDAKPTSDQKSSTQHAKRRKTARRKGRHVEPDLPRVLRKLFE